MVIKRLQMPCVSLAFRTGAKPELSSGMCRVCTQGIWWRRFGVSFHESNPKPLIALNFIQ